VIVATESKTNLRDQMREDYKASRELPALFSQQTPPIYKMCKLCGWHLSLDMIKTATSLGHSPAPPAPDAQPALAL
jgi:hypothetical protein